MPIITLTSDIGTKDYITGAVKGRLLQVNAQFNIIDITHELPPFNYPQASYICRNAFKNFPKNTFHILLVDLHNSNLNYLLMARHENQYIGCADNGLLTMILKQKPEEVVALPLDADIPKNILTFTDVFAKAYQSIINGADPDQVGDPNITIEEKNSLRPLQGMNSMEGQIIFIDNFENVVINITREEFEEQRRGRPYKIVFHRNETISKISNTYADVPQSEKVAIFNAAGYLEIAINKGNAAGLFGLEGYTGQAYSQNQFIKSRLLYQTVKILFEPVPEPVIPRIAP